MEEEIKNKICVFCGNRKGKHAPGMEGKGYPICDDCAEKTLVRVLNEYREAKERKNG